jgi:hypothetical protein
MSIIEEGVTKSTWKRAIVRPFPDGYASTP